jgi:hypothetical protein
VHRGTPPQVLESAAGKDAALVGVAMTAFDSLVDAARLARWAGGVR